MNNKILVFSLFCFFCTACSHFETGGGCEGDPNANEGINIKYYEKKVPSRIFDLDSCVLNGIDISFWPNGKIHSYGYGEKGREKGNWMFYDGTGLLKSIHIYENGSLLNVTNHTGNIIYDRTTSFLKIGTRSLSLSFNQDVANSHYTDLRVSNLAPDTIVLETTTKQIMLDKNLKIIDTISFNYSPDDWQ